MKLSSTTPSENKNILLLTKHTNTSIQLSTDHKNITSAETQYVNLHFLRKFNVLDQVYQAKLEYIAGTSNTGADGLSRFHMQDSILYTLVQEFYAINELDRTSNHDFPLSMDTIREE